MAGLLFANILKINTTDIKVFKLFIKDAYIIRFRVYAGKGATLGLDILTKIFTEIINEYLKFGRTVYIDNCYTCANLANRLFYNYTHLVKLLGITETKAKKMLFQKKKEIFYRITK